MTVAKDKQQLVVCLFFAPWCMACESELGDLLHACSEVHTEHAQS